MRHDRQRGGAQRLLTPGWQWCRARSHGRRLGLGRELADQIRDRWLRVQPGDQCFDLPLALVPGQGQHLVVILGGQVRSQQADRKEMHPSRGQVLEENREAPHRPGGFDAVVGGVFGEMQYVCTVLEQRGEAFGQVQAPLVELREMHHEGDGGLALALREGLHPREEVAIGKTSHMGENVTGVHA
jgi:hypothetical protein